MRFAVNRRPRPSLRDQSGMTIVELMLTMSLGLVILGSATLITIGASRHNTEVANRTDATQRGRLAMEKMVRLLRSQVCTTASTTPITDARADSVTFTANLTDGSQPATRHTLSFDPAARTLSDSRVVGSGAPLGFTAAPVSEQLATDVERAGTDAVFRYYAYPPAVPTPAPGVVVEPTVPLTPPTDGSLAAADAQRVARVDIHFLTTGATPTTRNIRAEMTNQVFVRIANPNNAVSFNPSCA